MSAALDPQVVEPQQVIALTDYHFSGDNRTVSNKCAFIDGYRLKGSIYHAAQVAGIARSTAYKWMDSDDEFARAVADATEDRDDRMETSVYERAFSDNLLAMFWLKAHRHKFRDKVTIDIQAVDEEIKRRLDSLNTLQIPCPPSELQKGVLQLPAGPPASDDDPRHS
jgi:hypothetical protein